MDDLSYQLPEMIDRAKRRALRLGLYAVVAVAFIAIIRGF